MIFPLETFINKIVLFKLSKSVVVNMAEAEYEILPHQLLSDLKYDVEALKKKLDQPDSKANELINKK